MKVAALDLGSNTTLMLIADVENGRVAKVFRDELVVTRMGQEVNANKKFHPAALARVDECLRQYAEIIGIERPNRVLAMATSAARDVTNANELFAVGEKYGIPIRVIPGELEARITFDGATFEYEKKDGLCVIDVGGGSTEVIASEENELVGTSVNVGSVRLTEMFVTKYPTPESEVRQLLEFAKSRFKEAAKLLPRAPASEVIAVAGTPTTLASVLQQKNYSEEAVHGFEIQRTVLEEWMYRFANMNLNERMAITGMDPKRADVIVAGCAVLLAAMQALRAPKMTVSTRGVRYGIALHAAQS